MSATSLGFLCAFVSSLCLAFLAASDSKRRSERRSPFMSLRPFAIAIALSPGALLPLTGRWVAFFIWIGTAAVLGWMIAALFSAMSSDKNARLEGASADTESRPDR
jgi:hypothetical protein